MKTSLIIRAGQLGNRHFQGLLKQTKKFLSICVVDCSTESLQVAKQKGKNHPYPLKIDRSSTVEKLCHIST